MPGRRLSDAQFVRKLALQSSPVSPLIDPNNADATELARTVADLTHVLDRAGIGTLFLDQDLRIRHGSGEVAAVLGITAADVGQKLGDRSWPGLSASLRDMAHEVSVTRELRALEARDGRGHWSLLQVQPHADAQGQPAGVLITAEDIGRLKDMEGQVRAYEDRLARISEHGDSEVLDRELTILLVEDADEDARLVEIALRDLPIPMNLSRVPTAREALNLLTRSDREPPDLVLMDLRLPGMSGREMLMAMREDMSLHEQPVIILSGLDYDFSVQDIHELGVHAFVSKPMDITDLDAVARVVLEFWAGLVLRPVWEDVSSSSGRRPRR